MTYVFMPSENRVQFEVHDGQLVLAEGSPSRRVQ